MNSKKVRVLVVQQFNRAYRVPLLKRLSEEPGIDLTLVHGTTPPFQESDLGLNIASGVMPFRTVSGPIAGLRVGRHEVLWFGKAVKLLQEEFFEVVICDYYTRFLSIWPMQSIQHRRNAAFVLWGIGFHRYPTPLIDKLRLLMIRRTDALLLYNEKEKRRYVEMGVPAEKFFVTDNTVDIESIDAAVAATGQQDILECKRKIGADDGPVIIHVGRLARNKRLDLLVSAVKKLQPRFPNVKLVLVGDGPERAHLESLVVNNQMQGVVHLTGSIMDPKMLAPWMLASDLVVAPAQIGLLAPMSYAYKRMLVISNESQHHYPELQVFKAGETGMIYKSGNVEDLAEVMEKLLTDPGKRNLMAETGAHNTRGPGGLKNMVETFLNAIRYVGDSPKSPFPCRNG